MPTISVYLDDHTYSRLIRTAELIRTQQGYPTGPVLASRIVTDALAITAKGRTLRRTMALPES